MNGCVCLCIMGAGVHEKRVLEPLKLELQIDVSHPGLALESESESSTSSASVSNCLVISPAQSL